MNKDTKALALIKKTIATENRCYPFNDDFDKDHFIICCEKIAQDNPFEDIEFQLMEATLVLNALYENLLETIEEDIALIDLNRNELISQIIAYTNLDYLNAMSMASNQYKENKASVVDFSVVENLGSVNVDGQEFGFSDAVDSGIDIANTLIDLIWTFNIEPGKKIENEERYGRIRRLIICANFLTNYKSAFDFCIFEFGSIHYEDNKIFFKHIPQHYYGLRVAGKQRESSKIQEGLIYGFKFFKEKVLSPEVSVSKGYAHLSNKKHEIPNLTMGYGVSCMITFYSHLNGVKLSKLGGIEVEEVILTLSKLRSILNELSLESIIEKNGIVQSTNDIPHIFNRKQLIKSLSSSTKLKEFVVVKIIDLLTTDLNSSIIDLWARPFIRDKNDLYFLIAPLKDGHLSYLIDKIVDQVLSGDELMEIYKAHLRKSILTKSGFKLDLISENQLNRIKGLPLKGNLIYSLQSTIIVVSPCLFSYPLDSFDYRLAIESISEASILNEQISQIIKRQYETFGYNLEPNLIELVVTNHTSLSGFLINSSYVIDEGLLNNYFITGGMIAGKTVGDGEVLSSDEISKFKYYSNEQEFNSYLEEFFLQPPPISEIISRILVDEYPISSKESVPLIFRDGVKFSSLEENVNRQTKELEASLEQLYYFEIEHQNNPDAERMINERIKYLLPIAINFLALNKGDSSDRVSLLKSLERGKLNSYLQVIVHLNQLVQKISPKKIVKNPIVKMGDLDPDSADKDLRILLEENFKGKQLEISFSTIQITHSLSNERKENLLRFLIGAINNIKVKYYSQEELEDLFFYSALFTALIKNEERYREYLYILFQNLIDTLNFNNYHQKARNVAEEALLLSIQIESAPTLGWICLFKCYLKQHNPVETVFYATLYFSALISLPKFPEFMLVDGIYNLMILYRELNFQNEIDILYQVLEKMSMPEYDKQKVKLSYFSSFLTRSHKDLANQLPQIIDYVKSNTQSIKEYGSLSIVPWLSFFYNLKNLFYRVDLWTEEYEVIVAEFESVLDELTLSNMKASYFPITDETNRVLENSLVKVFQSSNHHDFSHELIKLSLIANNAAKLAIDTSNIEQLLLSGIVLNDNYLTFTPQGLEIERVPLFDKAEDQIKESLSNYSKDLLSSITLSKKQSLIWIFSVEDKVYQLVILPSGKKQIMELCDWSLSRMIKWKNELDSFYYDDKDYFINLQEQDYVTTLNNTKGFELSLEDDMIEEVLICTSIRLTEYPHNLIHVNSSKLIANDSHEELVKEEIDNTIRRDFLSFNYPIINVLSLDWFKSNHQKLVIKKANLSISGWVPIEDEDYSLLINYGKLESLIVEEYSGEMHSEIIPKKELNSNINVFMAHGEKGLEGFKTVYTHLDGNRGHAIRGDQGVKKIFGTGEIAILFICNSAALSKDFHAQRINSFVNEIFKLGYSAVVAPGWKLSTDIPPVWLKLFLESFVNGQNSLVKAVHDANFNMAITNFDGFKRFYAPTAWASMHLYGNPNIVIR